jgi:hypothetical protein
LFGETFGIQSNALLARNISLYGQDTWKVTPRLTITYGLRWDINPPLKDKNPANALFTVTGLNDPSTIALAPRGTPLYQTTYGNVAPRIGIAYQLRRGSHWDSVLRSGFGVFYDLGYGSLGGAPFYFPFEAVRVIPGAKFPLSAQDAAPPPFSFNPPVPTIIVADPHLRVPRTYQCGMWRWNNRSEAARRYL